MLLIEVSGHPPKRIKNKRNLYSDHDGNTWIYIYRSSNSLKKQKNLALVFVNEICCLLKSKTSEYYLVNWENPIEMVDIFFVTRNKEMDVFTTGKCTVVFSLSQPVYCIICRRTDDVQDRSVTLWDFVSHVLKYLTTVLRFRAVSIGIIVLPWDG